jgi:hypothetical protein
MTKDKSGYCVYLFAHGGVGRIVEETKDMEKLANELNKPGSDAYYIVCDAEKKVAIKKYNELKAKEQKKIKEQVKKKIVPKKSKSKSKTKSYKSNKPKSIKKKGWFSFF